MSRKTSLECMSNKVCLVIRKCKKIPLEKIKAYCEYYFLQYAFIEHENDIQPDTGLVEDVHYHIVGNFNNLGGRKRFSTRLNDIVDWFRFDNANGIQIEQYDSLARSLQYLVHKNQKEKTPHQVSEIITNFEKCEFDMLMSCDVGDVMSFDYIYNELLIANNILDVIKAVGIKNYRDYRNVIWDMWNCIKSNA